LKFKGKKKHQRGGAALHRFPGGQHLEKGTYQIKGQRRKGSDLKQQQQRREDRRKHFEGGDARRREKAGEEFV